MPDQVLPLVGRSVSRCFVGDWVFWLEFIQPDEVFLCIECSFLLHRQGRTTQIAHGDLEALGKAIVLAGKEVTRSVAHSSGLLELVFSDESFLQVPPHHSYEAWRFEGPGSLLIVCKPGGGLALWDA